MAATSLLVSVAAAADESLGTVTKELSALKGGGEGGEEGRGHKAFLFVYAERYDKLSLTNDTKKILFDAASRHWKEFVDNRSRVDKGFDEGVDDLSTVEFSAYSRASLVELAKTHPLLVCRKVGLLRDTLERDGMSGPRR